jgi:hypothetical protein
VQRTFIGGGLLILTCGFAVAQDGRDPRLDELRAEIAQLGRIISDQDKRLEDLEKGQSAQLRRTITDQERRIADLEKTVRTLQAALAPPPHRIPSPIPVWTQPLNWGRLKAGMSEAQVTELLGPPTRVSSVVDKRTLYYQPDAKSTSPLHGMVTLVDDRVTAVEPPDF